MNFRNETDTVVLDQTMNLVREERERPITSDLARLVAATKRRTSECFVAVAISARRLKSLVRTRWRSSFLEEYVFRRPPAQEGREAAANDGPWNRDRF